MILFTTSGVLETETRTI